MIATLFEVKLELPFICFLHRSKRRVMDGWTSREILSEMLHWLARLLIRGRITLPRDYSSNGKSFFWQTLTFHFLLHLAVKFSINSLYYRASRFFTFNFISNWNIVDEAAVNESVRWKIGLDFKLSRLQQKKKKKKENEKSWNNPVKSTKHQIWRPYVSFSQKCFFNRVASVVWKSNRYFQSSQKLSENVEKFFSRLNLVV